MLDLVNISKRYGDQVALAPSSLHFVDGQTTILIGPSGCGKSTLLRLIAALIPADEGQLLIKGSPLTADMLLNWRRRLGYVIQEGGLFPHLTAAANVTLMARFLGWQPARIDNRLNELAELVHMPASLLQRYPLELSGGQRQRISLMRALMLDPELLLLDEPLGALDPMIRYSLQQELKQIFKQLGKTVIMVTHDMAEAAFFGHTLVLMREGHVVQQGDLQTLVRSPAEPFVEEFITAQRGLIQQLDMEIS